MELKKRDSYLEQLIRFQDTSSVKVVTGIRRCGKSKLLELMVEHLGQTIGNDHILKMNFESLQFSDMTYKQMYQYVLSHASKKGRTYLFLDEPHMVSGWERVVASLKTDLDCDIYITGFNSHMLSSEYSTLLSGRYVEIKMLPLSFKEFLDFRNWKVVEEPSSLGGKQKACYDEQGRPCDLEDVFSSYLRYGGMPGLSELPLNNEIASSYLDAVYNKVITNDILQREEKGSRSRIVDPLLLRKLSLFLAGNIGKELSCNKVTVALNENAVMKNQARVGNPKIQDYLKGLLQSFIFYESKRYDLRGKQLLKTNGKFYIVDLGIKNYLLGYQPYDQGFALENLVYFELLRRGYEVQTGKIGPLEVDFRAVKGDEVAYIQVSQSLKDEATREREILPFTKIDDFYDRVILTMDKVSSNLKGIKVLNLMDWLLS